MATHRDDLEADLDEFEETHELSDDGREPPPVPPPANLDEAHRLMRRLARQRAMKKEVEDTAAARIAAYKLWVEDRTKSFDRLIARYSEAIEAWQRATGTTSNKTPWGTSTLRKQPSSTRVTDPKAFVAWAMAKPARLVAVKIEPLVSQLRAGLHLQLDEPTDFIDGGASYSAERYLDDDERPVPGVLVLTPKEAKFNV